MDLYEGTLLALLGLLVAVVLVMLGSVRRRARWQQCRYRVFALRDEMVRLVAEGHLRPDDPIYVHTVRLMNSLIRHMPSFTASEVARGVLRADEADHRRVSFEDYTRALAVARPEVADVVGRFWNAVALILYDNSASLRTFVWLRSRFSGVANFVVRLIRRLGKPPSWQAYRLSQNHLEASRGSLATA